MAGRHPPARISRRSLGSISELLIPAVAANTDPGRVRLEIGGACALPVQNGGFEVVCSGLMLMFVADGERAAREMSRVARRGTTTVAAATWDFQGGQTAARMTADTVTALGVPGVAEWRTRLMGGPGAGMQALTCPGAEFTLVASSLTLMFIAYGERATRAIVRVARPGARLRQSPGTCGTRVDHRACHPT